ncbi:type IV pilus biogenesis protein PilM [Xenorhabdus nematophila]|uniref:type IV pilus biogenesis protein PilM n=1 Tax=Xenorhabdus nematophila TaxID=628 RepID=UPI0032B81AC9
MAYILMAAFSVFLLIANSVDLGRGIQTEKAIQEYNSAQLASGMIVMANVLGIYLYKKPIQDGVVNIEELPLLISPDPRIHHVVKDGRIWVYINSKVPELMQELHRLSKGSALICIVENGKLKMLTGENMNLPLPSDLKEGTVVYLN